jgi:hypothetical protein
MTKTILGLMIAACVALSIATASAAPTLGQTCTMSQWGTTTNGLTCTPRDGESRWRDVDLTPYDKAKLLIARKNRTIAYLRVQLQNERIDNDYQRAKNLKLEQEMYQLILRNEELEAQNKALKDLLTMS